MMPVIFYLFNVMNARRNMKRLAAKYARILFICPKKSKRN
jgi:hypothetical protein